MSEAAADNEQAEYWNNEGGERWIRYLDHLERMLEGLSRHLVEAVDARPGEHVLDIGCGGGPTSAAYAQAVGTDGAVLGVDISRVILDVTRQRFTALPQLRFETADAASYPFTPDSFDVVASRFGVMFFPDPAAAFGNIHTGAKAGSRLRFLCWRGIDENPWMGATAAAAFTVIPAPEKPAPGAPGPFSFADPERVREILTTAGFRDVSFEKVDEPITIGTVDHALDWLSNMGPAATPLAEASESDRAAAQAEMRKVLEAHDTMRGVTLPGAAWLVSATA